MKLTIKFSNIPLPALCEICYTLKKNSFNSDYINHIVYKVYKIINYYYFCLKNNLTHENKFKSLFKVNNNPDSISELLEYKFSIPFNGTYFTHLFIWESSEEGHEYWKNLNDIIYNYYKNKIP